MNKIHEVMSKFRSGSEVEAKGTGNSPPTHGSIGAQYRDNVSHTTESRSQSATSASGEGGGGSGGSVGNSRFYISDGSSSNPTSDTGRNTTASIGEITLAAERLSLQNFLSSTSVGSSSKSSSASTLEASDGACAAVAAGGGGGDGGDDGDDTVAGEGKSPLERKPSKPKPKGTFEYCVKDRDTLVKIGAHFDVTPSELMKVNRMMSRNIFPGQVLFIPDPDYVPSDPPSPVASPVDTRPRVDVSFTEMSDQPMVAVPGHAVQVPTTAGVDQALPVRGVIRQASQEELDEADQECLKKFVKMPAMRFVETEEDLILVNGTFLLTPNALMFDPEGGDPQVKACGDQLKYQFVVYMEDLKSVAIFNEYLGKHRDSYNVDETDKPPSPSEGSIPAEEKQASQSDVEVKVKSDGDVTGRTSEELEKMEQMVGHVPDLNSSQPGRASKEIETAMMSASRSGNNQQSPSTILKQMSRSSEAASTEMTQLADDLEVFGETRDFGRHLGRSSSEAHRQMSSVNSPGLGGADSAGVNNGGQSGSGRSESVSEGASLHTPTQGFAPVHFTDRSPHYNTVLAHPTPVPGSQRSSLEGATASPNTSLNSASPVSSSSQQLILSPSSLVSLSDAKPDGSKIPKPSNDSNPNKSFTAPSSSTHTSNPNKTNMIVSSDKTAKPAVDRTSSGSLLDSAVSALSFSNPHNSNQHGLQDSTDSSGNLLSSFSPSQQISNFFQFTSNFIRGASSSSASSPGANTTPSRVRSVSGGVAAPGLALRCDARVGASQEEASSEPSNELYYLQIKPGPLTQPRDDVDEYLDEYWLSVPKNKTDRLYTFIMAWQPIKELPEDEREEDDEAPQEKYFYDQREVEHLIKGVNIQLEGAVGGAGDGALAASVGSDGSGIRLLENHFSDKEKSWSIVHRSEVALALPPAAAEEAEDDDDSMDEGHFPELLGGKSKLLTEHQWKDLYKVVPRQMSVGYNYEMVYATHKHGFSLLNLYGKMQGLPDSPVWLIIKDKENCVFGAYLSDNMKESGSFYGSGYTFLFTWYPSFRHFHWQGDNDFFMHGERESFSIGVGQQGFGLFIDGDLHKGRSVPCATFRNEMLSLEEDFFVKDIEVWKFTEPDYLFFPPKQNNVKPPGKDDDKKDKDDDEDGASNCTKKRSLSAMIEDSSSIRKSLYTQ